jgi:hypothetical protein
MSRPPAPAAGKVGDFATGIRSHAGPSAAGDFASGMRARDHGKPRPDIGERSRSDPERHEVHTAAA